ncbi:winged helix-turn-helix domain-containing protein [Thalassovita sp.]|uniref:winged helix-turn-helix domain-containing protein n=1 Tax=Thalassovita sp. TaxID=1979401 RepID=UPI0029DE890B|nr:crosslink repair DNA glycosylase YcaQ family protein [Thalassovita sp.]
MAIPVLPNALARRLFLQKHLLSGLESGTGRGQDLLSVIRRLGFVQLDSINTVARAHDLILFARRPSYRPRNLELLLERDRTVFEHWTHDASIIPTEFRPYWTLKCARDAEGLPGPWRRWQQHDFEHLQDAVLARIGAEGPLCSADLDSGDTRKGEGWWDWHPGKTALEYLWRCGHLAVDRREGFRKYYDLSERVLPPAGLSPPQREIQDWACNAALDRLGFATAGELAAFWGMVSNTEAREWADKALRQGTVGLIEVEGADGKRRRCLARPDVMAVADAAAEPTGRIRVLSPFDPALRDRSRAERLFGFSYRIEIFVPAAKRSYGYYVFPLLEGDRLIGRIDMKADRKAGALNVTALWPETGVRFGKVRLARLESELQRVARFAGCGVVNLASDWLRDH